MKKILFLSLFFFALVVVAPHALAQEGGFVPLAPIPGLTAEGADTSVEGLPTFFNNLYKFLIGIAAILAIIQIIRSGIELALNQGSVSEIISAKGRVAQAIFGLVLVLTPALVFGIINPDILNLSVGLSDITYPEKDPSTRPTATVVAGNGAEITFSGSKLLIATVSASEKQVVRDTINEFVHGPSCAQNTLFIWSERRYDISCPGGYAQSGACSGGFIGRFDCSFRSQEKVTLLDISDPGEDEKSSLFVVNQANSEFSSFEEACSSDGGVTCILTEENDGFGLQKLRNCPDLGSTRIPDGAPNADDGGECYEASLACPLRTSDLAKRALCQPDSTLFK